MGNVTKPQSNERLEIVKLVGEIEALVSSKSQSGVHRLVFACLEEANIRDAPEAMMLKDLATFFSNKRSQMISKETQK